MKLNQKITDSHNEVLTMSDQTIQELLRDVCTGVSHLFRTSESIAMLDMLAAFAQLATSYDYIRPELTDTLAIKAGRHPIREQIHKSKYIPNDAYATAQARFQIITGCNMSGKSTYIRSLALITVMAQIGCFVPAQYASFPVSQQLFARVATTDDLDANVSTFAAEMREMAFILRHVQPQSMILIDELGRGTSTTDGLAIAVALAEALIASKALVWFVTHFHDLAYILSERSGVFNLHLAADIAPEAAKMTMHYRIAEGPVPDRRYGLSLARLVDLPPAVLEVAGDISDKLDRIAQRRSGSSRTVAIARKRKLLLSLREQLILAREGKMDDESLCRWLKRLQNEFIIGMAAVAQDLESAKENDASINAAEDEDRVWARSESDDDVSASSSTSDSDQVIVQGISASEPIQLDSESESESESSSTTDDSVMLV